MRKFYTRQILKGVASYPGHMGGNMKEVVCRMQTVTCHVALCLLQLLSSMPPYWVHVLHTG